MVATNMTPYELITSPGTLDHLNRFAVRKASVTGWAGVWRSDQGLVCLAVGAVEEVGEKAAGLAHGDPGVAACGRVVEGAATHVDSSEFELRDGGFGLC